MTLKEIIKGNKWEEVESTFLSIFPKQKRNIIGYNRVFKKLKGMQEEPNDMVLEPTKVTNDDSEEGFYIDVCGTEKTISKSGKKKTETYSLIYVPWRKWLGMQVSKKTLKVLNELEIISSCIFEMTFLGFTDGQIKKEISKLDKAMQESKNMTKEEKIKNAKKVEELLDKYS